MRTPLVMIVLLALAACRAGNGVLPEANVPTGVVDTEAEQRSAQSQRPVLSTEVLPSLSNQATVRTETPMLQRPTAGSVILRTLAAGETVQLLGALDNADGQWRSVGLGDMQGWVRAAAVTP